MPVLHALSVLTFASHSLAAVAPDAAGSAVQPIVRDDFSRQASRWETLGGTWEQRDAAYVGEGSDSGRNCISYPRDAPILAAQSVEADVVMQRRLVQGGWCFAGMVVFLDPSNFWLLGLTEGPDGRRYVDFLESQGGIWQAQNHGKTVLEATQNENMNFRWEYGRPYRLRLSLDDDGIEAVVLDPGDGTPLASARYAFGVAQAVRMGIGGVILRECRAAFDNVLISGPAVAAGGDLAVEQGTNGTIAVLRDDLPGSDLSVADHLGGVFRAAGFGVTFLTARQASSPVLLAPERFLLYVIPNAQVYPGEGMAALMGYLRRGGHLMVLGGPAFSRPVWQYRGRWLDQDLLRASLADVEAESVVVDFDGSEDLAGWTRACNDPSIASRIELVGDGPDGTGTCMRVSTEKLTGWNTYASPAIEGMFADGHDLLCFWAKGDAATTKLSVEMNEADGSRWIAVVPLTTEWKRLALTSGDFSYWSDSPTGNARGGSRDRFNPQQANRIVVGLAHSHTGSGGDGPNTFWLDRLGTAVNPFADFTGSTAGTALALESIYPSYKVYDLRGVARLTAAAGQSIVSPGFTAPAPTAAVSSFVRPKGKGVGHDRKWRWIPLVSAVDGTGVVRGAAMWMLVNHVFPFRRSVFVGVGINDGELIRHREVSSALVAAARRIGEGVFLAEGGSRQFSYWPGEEVELGAAVRNLSSTAAAGEVRITVRQESDGAEAFRKQAAVRPAPDDSASVSFRWAPAPETGTEFVVTTELLRADGTVVDTISHSLGILSTAAAAPDEFVTVEGGDFYLRGRKWYPVGVNFWALYVSGLDPADYWRGWLDPAFYDPEEAEKDLERMAALGMNMVSIQMEPVANVRSLLDFLRRCGKHGIKVNGFLGAASPLGFDEGKVRAYIEGGRLAANPNLFAYDTIWEPGNYVFSKDRRGGWDREWEAWIAERYGSVANAETDWGVPVPRGDDGKITSPAESEFRQDGPWRVLMAAYRRFMDDLMSRKWNAASQRLRAIDPNHLVSFRQGNTLPHDFTLTATPKHIDFICPEGYSITHSEDGYNAAGFITRYVHFTTRGKPIIWAEFGRSVWDRATMAPDAPAIALQADYHDLFYRMVLESGANGTAPWWWPGGYRVGERSDFGICNPDGTPRPAAVLASRYGPAIKAPRAYPEPDEWLTIDRDADAGGYWRLAFGSGAEAYRTAVQAGHNLGVKTVGTGTTSADTPLAAVGNVPYRGSNPPKYLNAEFNWLRIKGADGEWVEVSDGTRVPVPAGAPVLAKVSVGNTQEATWLSPASAGAGPGSVYLVSTPASELSFERPVEADTPYLGDADFGTFPLTSEVAKETRVELHMSAKGRALFGEKRTFVLVPE